MAIALGDTLKELKPYKPRRQIPEYARRADKNQPSIVRTFRKLGCSVQHLHRVGEGCPDILVGIVGLNLLVEIKNGDKPPSQRSLNDRQKLWHGNWLGNVFIVKNEEEAADLVHRAREFARKWGQIQ